MEYFADVNVGDQVSGSFKDTVSYVSTPGQQFAWLATEGGLRIYYTDKILDFKITKPLPPLPTTEGSAVLCKDKVWGHTAPFVLVKDDGDGWWDVHDSMHSPKDYTILYDAGKEA